MGKIKADPAASTSHIWEPPLWPLIRARGATAGLPAPPRTSPRQIQWWWGCAGASSEGEDDPSSDVHSVQPAGDGIGGVLCLQ